MECNGCTLCCELFPVKWLNKPPNTICKFCDKGCTIQDTKLEECRNFDCIYIQDELDMELRPDKTGVVFEPITTRIYFGTYKTPKVWESPIVKKYIDNLNGEGISVLFSSFNDKREIKIFTTKGHTEDGVLKVVRMIELKRR